MTKKRGFAAMDPERRREIARSGGAAVPSDKRSFAQDRQLAARAGAKGGAASKRPTDEEVKAALPGVIEHILKAAKAAPA
jgi:hypothetical protein